MKKHNQVENFEEDDDIEQDEEFEAYANGWRDLDDDDEEWDDDDDYEEYYDDDEHDFSDEEVVIDSAEGFQVITFYDAEGNVVDASVMSDEDIDALGTEERSLASYLDSTILKPDATIEQIISLCEEARRYKFASVCVNSCWVRLCAELLRGTNVSVCSVVGFPLGAMIPEAKAFEATAAIENGATEIDMVLNIGALKSGDYRMVAKDLNCVAEAAHNGGAMVKVIIETCLLTREEKIIACLLAKNAGVDFVKTSTGFSTAGATVEDVALMRKVVGEDIGVKAAGGIRTKEDAEKMIEAGATRIGTSSGKKIVEG